MPPNVAVAIALSDAERDQLEAWTRRRTSAQALAQRARIVLAAAEGLKNTEIAERLDIDHATVRKWRNRFGELRLDGLTDEPRPGRPRTISDAQVEEVIVRTLETAPKDATHWSTRSMAREVGLTQTAVSRIWRAFGLQPHRTETWKLSRDPLFIDKVRDVVGLYLLAPDKRFRGFGALRTENGRALAETRPFWVGVSGGRRRWGCCQLVRMARVSRL